MFKDALTRRQPPLERIDLALRRCGCLSPASVFDPLSARIAESVGFELGLLCGSVSSITSLAAPDVAVLRLAKLAD